MQNLEFEFYNEFEIIMTLSISKILGLIHEKPEVQRPPLNCRNITNAGMKEKMRELCGSYHARPENRIHVSDC